MVHLIYTSYYGAMKKLPKSVLPVAISRYWPKGIAVASCEDLAPPADLLTLVKSAEQAGDPVPCELFKSMYTSRVLDFRDPAVIVSQLEAAARFYHKEDICLLCYEKLGDVCHRHFVSEWLNDAGYTCVEYEFGGD